MKRNKGLVITAILLIVMIAMFTSLGLYAWAKYRSSTPGDAVAQVARWNFKMRAGETETTEPTPFAITRTDGYGNVVAESLAPGTFGEIPVFIDMTGTEVVTRLDLTFTITDCPRNIKFYASDKDRTKNRPIKIEQTVDANDRCITTINITKYYSISDETADDYVGKVHNETIYWKWEYETLDDDNSSIIGDEIDKADSGKNAQMLITATGTEIQEMPEPYVMIGDTKVVKSKAGEYYGKEVDYVAGEANTTWRLFYIDYDNKYGDGEGTIYLKADYSTARPMIGYNVYRNYTSSSDTKIEEMNPQWAKDRAKTNDRTPNWREGERTVAYLCDTNQWKKYITTNEENKSYVNYAIGSPSVEMYIDSYKQSGMYNKKLEYLYQNRDPACGYMFLLDSINKWSVNIMTDLTNNRDKTIMYTSLNQSGYWWLASPSCNYYSSVLAVYMTDPCLTDEYYNNGHCVCPVVSIKNNAPFEFSE